MKCCKPWGGDRKSTRLNSSHSQISYAVFCLKKQKPPDTSLLLQTLESAREHVVEWGALPVALLGRLAPRVRERLGKNAWDFPLFFVNDGATTEIYTLSLHDALPI